MVCLHTGKGTYSGEYKTIAVLFLIAQYGSVIHQLYKVFLKSINYIKFSLKKLIFSFYLSEVCISILEGPFCGLFSICFVVLILLFQALSRCYSHKF